MSITRVGSAYGLMTADISGLSVQEGDLLLVFATRKDNAGIATQPNYTTVFQDNTTISTLLSYKVVESGAETLPTWSSATVSVHVYRSDSVDLVTGGHSPFVAGTTNNAHFPEVTMDSTDGSSWVANFYGYLDTLELPALTGATKVGYIRNWGVNTSQTTFDSNGGVVAWPTTNSSTGEYGINTTVSVEIKEFISSVIITDTTDPLTTNTQATINLTGGQASQGSGSVVQRLNSDNTVSELTTIDTWSDTQIIVNSTDIESSSLAYGTHDFLVAADNGDDDFVTFECLPVAGRSFVDLGLLAEAGVRLEAISDLDAGDQVRYQSVLYQGGSPTAYSVTVNDDATFTVDGSTPDGSYAFEIKIWDVSDSTWGLPVNQIITINDGVIVSVTNEVTRKSMIRPMIRAMIRSMTRPMIGAIKRYFITLDPVVNAHYTLSTPITFTGDFRCDFEFQLNLATGDHAIISDGLALNLSWFRVDATNGGYEVQLNGTFYSQVGMFTPDARLHTGYFERIGSTMKGFLDGVEVFSATVVTTSIEVGMIGARGNGSQYFDGILANPKFTDNSGTPVTTTFKLGEPTANSELSVEGNNTVNYINIPTTDREEFQLSGDGAQWDNISPEPQELPSVIEIA